jgi:CspA family cold shock protein
VHSSPDSGIFSATQSVVSRSKRYRNPDLLVEPVSDRRFHSISGLLVLIFVLLQDVKGVVVKEKGTVKWFNGAKGYGFIQRSTGEDVFVHYSVIQENGYRTLNEGETVEFECVKGPKGLQAQNVSRG